MSPADEQNAEVFLMLMLRRQALYFQSDTEDLMASLMMKNPEPPASVV